MAIPKKWSRVTRQNLARVPDEPGAYEIAIRLKRTIDIGSSGNLAERIPRKVKEPKFRGQAAYFRYVEDHDPEQSEAEIQADFIAKHG